MPYSDILQAKLSSIIMMMSWISTLLALCEGKPPVTIGFPSQRPVTQSFDDFFYLHLNKWYAGDLRRHDTHYDAH